MSTASSPLDGDVASAELTDDDPPSVEPSDRFFDQDAPAPARVVVDEAHDEGTDLDDTVAEPDAEPTDDAGSDAGLDDELPDDEQADDELADAAGEDETGLLGDELDAELEAEAAGTAGGMAPLVELPDRAAFGEDGHRPDAVVPTPAVTEQHTATGDLLTVRVRGQGRVPARKVRRVIRRVDPLSVLKLSFFFNICLFAMFLVAALLLWSAAIGSGSTDNIESFVIDIGFEDFRLVGSDLFRGFVVFGGGLVIVGTVVAVLLALLFNLISDIVGGIRFTVIEPVVDPVEPAVDGTDPGAV